MFPWGLAILGGLALLGIAVSSGGEEGSPEDASEGEASRNVSPSARAYGNGPPQSLPGNSSRTASSNNVMVQAPGVMPAIAIRTEEGALLPVGEVQPPGSSASPAGSSAPYSGPVVLQQRISPLKKK